MKLLSLFVVAAVSAEIQTAHLTFRPDDSTATYTLAVLADGNPVLTPDSATKISLVDAPDYYAAENCVFDTVDPAKTHATVSKDNVTGQVVFEPATAIRSVSCQGSCVATNENCFDDRTGQYIGSCCNGLCAANRCRPWNTGRT